MTTDELLEQAWNEAQVRFRAMLDAKSYSDPDASETRAYIVAERIVDALLIEAQWDASKSAMDALIDADRDDLLTSEDIEDLSLGDHYAGMPEGVVEGLPEFNGSFR